MSRISFCRALLAGVIAAGVPPVSAEEIRPTLALFTNPILDVPPIVPADMRRHTALWLAALKRPEAEMQRLAAEAIERAQTMGIAGLKPARDDLLKIVTAEKSHPVSRIAAARALAALECGDTAAELQSAAERHGTLLRQVVEPALAQWDHQPMRDVWLARLDHPETHRRELMLALACLATVREQRAGPPCLALVKDPQQPADVRLAAAQAAGQVAETGWEEAATELLGTGEAPVLHRLCAVALLSRHGSAEARQILTRLAQDGEPAVAAPALARLLAIDPDLVLPLADAAMGSTDANVRRRGAEAYVLRPAPDRIKALSKLLDDPHPLVRQQMREDLFRLAKIPQLEQSVLSGAMEVLAGDGWRGQEQAALLLAALAHRPAAPRLVELLESERPEVMVATAWALRTLAVPETLPAMLDKARRQTEFRKKGVDTPGLDDQVAHLCEAFGLMSYAPAEPLLREYIPKKQIWTQSRMAGIWALGHLYKGKPDEQLASLFIARLTDPDPINPEVAPARMASAISLGRMKAKAHVDAMRAWMGPATEPEPVDMAIRWAIIEITGEQLPPTTPPVAQTGIWFLEPVEPAGKSASAPAAK